MRERKGFLFDTISCEGSLFPPEFLHSIVDKYPPLEGVTPEAYHLTEEKLNEAINRSWLKLLQRWRTFRRLYQSEHTSALREYWVFPLFIELGYGRLVSVKPLEIEGKKYPVSHSWGQLPIHIVGIQKGLDDRLDTVRKGGVQQSPHMLVQELLNRSSEHPWGIVTNGLRLRLLRHNKRLVHRTYIEFDLEAMMEGEVYADFILFWLLCHQSRFEREGAGDCWLEKWSRLAHEQSSRALGEMGRGVEKAVCLLGQGFLACRTNQQLREKLRSGTLKTEDYFRQILRLIYRLIMLFVAEDRGLLLLPDATEEAKERFNKYYSTARLRQLARKYRGTQYMDLFQGMRCIMQQLAQDPGYPELALPTLDGFLFERTAVADLEECDLSNACLLEVVRSLSFLEQDGRLRPVDFRHMGAEELGSIYEGVLDFQAVVENDPPCFRLEIKPGHLRKSSGSYYTPPELVKSLLDSTLEPVLAEACNQQDPEAALLNLKVCDPACGSGHFLIEAARRIAYRLAFVRAGNIEADRETWCAATRDVVRHCIYGVDMHDMAVELCKVSLSIEAIEAGKPLIFLDHRILCGDSLIGTTPALLQKGIPGEAFIPSEGDMPPLAQAYRQRNQEGLAGQWHLLFEPMDTVVDQLEKLQTQDDSSYEHIQEIKQCHQFAIRRQEYQKNLLLAHAWCAAFFWRKARIASSSRAFPITQGILRELLENNQIYQDMRRHIESMATEYHFFHWHLAFPDVFKLSAKDEMPENGRTGWNGGFDVVIGNPPYLFGEQRDPRMKTFLQSVFQLAKGQYDTYWLFIELGLHLIHSKGRFALIVPDTLLARDETQRAREMLLREGLESIIHCGMAFKASVSTISFVVVAGKPSEKIFGKILQANTIQPLHTYSKQRFLADPKHRLLIHLPDEEAHIYARIERASQPLHTLVKISRGEEIGKKAVHAQGSIPILVGEDIARYFVKQPSRFLLASQKDSSRYQAPKIVMMKTGRRCIAGLDTVGYVTMQSVYSLHLTSSEIEYETLLALLNSQFVYCYIYKNFTSYKELFPQMNQSTIQSIPVPMKIGGFQETLKVLVDDAQCVNKQFQMAQNTQQKAELRSQAMQIENDIDQIIYHLYGLTDEEIKIVNHKVL